MRLFIAIPLPGNVRAELEENARSLREAGCGGTFSREENYHLTLAFLGECAPGDVPALKRVMDGCRAAPMELTLAQTGCFGDTLWRGVRAPQTLAALQGSLTDALERAGFRTERRPFRPHLTLARRVTLPDGKRPADYAFPPLRFSADRMTLFLSERVAGKLTYTPLYTVQLR